MKKAVVFVVLTMVMIGSCAAQNATADQRIVGTWIITYEDGRSATYVFNANGTGTRIDRDGETLKIFWGVSVSGEICISRYDNNSGNYYKYAISPDGRSMFIGSAMFQKK